MNDTKLKKIAEFLLQNNLTIATAESCTGGLLASRFTDIAGSSGYINESHVTYANSAKHKYLGVKNEIFDKYGAVSYECAHAMAEGLQKLSNCDIAVCTTGIAGPGGENKEKPVGIVFVSVLYKGKITVKEYRLPHLYPRKLMKFMFTQKAIDTIYNVIKCNFIG